MKAYKNIRPKYEDIFQKFENASDAEKSLAFYQENDGGYPFPATIVTWEAKFYVIMLLTNKSKEYYR